MERIVYILLASTLLAVATANRCTSSEASVLLCFKERLENNTSLQSWNISAPLRSWKGTVWRNGRVVGINVSGAGLSGELASSAFWCHLPLLEYIVLSHNKLRGSRPLHGPKCRTSQLSQLDLSNNMFTGSLPDFIFSMPRLAHLYLHGNKLTGSLPSSLTNSSRLQTLVLRDNNFTGALPSLAHLSQLVRLDVQGNGMLTGPFPRLDGNPRLQLLNLARNNFTGSIHESVFTLGDLRALLLHVNRFSGAIPAGIGKLSNIRVLNLQRNRFYGPLPPTIGMLRKLKFLEVGYNRLTGNFPDSMASMSLLEYLSVTTNSMSGQLPRWIGRLERLRTLDMWRNHFTGTIPKEFGELKYLSSEDSKPEDDPDTDFLQLGIIFLPTGGSAKDELMNIPYRNYPTTLDFCDNNFTGVIPEELGKLQSLQHLWLCTNGLTGSIPSSLASMKSLILLQLYENHLTGSIPPQLGELSSLTYFNVSYNKLTGRIPSSTQFTTFESSSFLGNPELCGLPLSRECPPPPGPARAPAVQSTRSKSASSRREFLESFLAAAAFSFIVMLLGMTRFGLLDAHLLILVDKVKLSIHD